MSVFLYALRGDTRPGYISRGGVGTHWQPLNTLQTPRKCEPGLCSGEENAGQGGCGGGGGEGAGGCGHALAAFKYSLNT